MPKYKWESPYDWLTNKTDQLQNENDIPELQDIIRSLALKLDADTIQDLFQSEMDADGYFEELAE